MVQILGLLLISFFAVSVLLVPYINLLYKIKFLRQRQKTRDIFEAPTPIFDRLHASKIGTPVGGGALIIILVSVLFLIIVNVAPFFGFQQTSVYPLSKEIKILLFTFVSFGALGLLDDIRKTFNLKRTNFWGLRFRYKFLVQWILALSIAFMLYFQLGISIVNIRFFDVVNLGYFYIPFAAFVIVSFANAVNISDGLDGLASGLLIICLIAFLYFNVWPARIWLGDVGVLSFGATLAVCGLLLGKPIALAVIGGVFVAEVSSSAVQLLSKKFRGKRVFEVAPFHLWLQNKGWQEPKIVFRFWLAQTIFAVLGLWLSFF